MSMIGVRIRIKTWVQKRINPEYASTKMRKNVNYGTISSQCLLCTFSTWQVSSIKSDLDEMKGKTLEEMSKMVEKFHKRIAEKKSDLAPIIKVSRNMPRQFMILWKPKFLADDHRTSWASVLPQLNK